MAAISSSIDVIEKNASIMDHMHEGHEGPPETPVRRPLPSPKFTPTSDDPGIILLYNIRGLFLNSKNFSNRGEDKKRNTEVFRNRKGLR